MRESYKHSPETIEKIRQSHIGKTASAETRKKLSDSHKGIPAWNKGIKRWWTSPTEFKKGQNAGSNHPMWKGGNSKNYKTGYYSAEYKDWRKKVFERDNYVCRGCGSIGYVTAHHVKSFACFPELRFDVDNGITLCEPCHKKTDNYKGKGKKNPIDRTVYGINGANSAEIPTEISGQHRAKSEKSVNV